MPEEAKVKSELKGEFPCPKCRDEVEPDCKLCKGTGTYRLELNLDKEIKNSEGWLEYFKNGDGLTGYDQELQMMRYQVVLQSAKQFEAERDWIAERCASYHSGGHYDAFGVSHPGTNRTSADLIAMAKAALEEESKNNLSEKDGGE